MLKSENIARMLADAIQRITSDLGVPYIFKASYDKANRTSIRELSRAGVSGGLPDSSGLLGRSTGLRVLADVISAGLW